MVCESCSMSAITNDNHEAPQTKFSHNVSPGRQNLQVCLLQACQSRTGKLVSGLDVSKDRDGRREKRDRTGGTETHVVKERGGNEQNNKTERWNWHLRSPVQTDRAETREREREKKKKQRWATSEHLTGIRFVNRACLHPIKPWHTDNIPAWETLCDYTLNF